LSPDAAFTEKIAHAYYRDDGFSSLGGYHRTLSVFQRLPKAIFFAWRGIILNMNPDESRPA